MPTIEAFGTGGIAAFAHSFLGSATNGDAEVSIRP